MARMFHCNKSYIFCNIFNSAVLFLSSTWKMAEVLFIAFSEIARTGETEFHRHLLDGHIGGSQEFVCAYQPPFTDIV